MVLEAIKKRRSIRKYVPGNLPVPPEKITSLLEAGFYAPTACNRRLTEFLVVTKREKLEKLASATKWSLMIRKASLCIVVMCKKTTEYWLVDSAAATENILLEAVNQGLGAVWVAIQGAEREDGGDPEEYVRNLLGIPEDMGVLCLISVGFPAKEKTPHTPEEFDPARAHWNTYGTPPPPDVLPPEAPKQT